jgi:hypothetical protein
MSTIKPWPLAAAAWLCSAPCLAQNAVTIYGGYQDGGSFQRVGSPNSSVALAGAGAVSFSIDWAVQASRQVQLFATTQRTELAASTSGVPQPAVPLTVTYLHLGGTNFFDGPDARIGRGPYVVGGLGMTVMSPGLSGLSTEVRPSINLGIGYQVPLAQNLSLRLELRGFITLINSSTNLFCSGGCVVNIQGDSFGQGQALAGLSYSF